MKRDPWRPTLAAILLGWAALPAILGVAWTLLHPTLHGLGERLWQRILGRITEDNLHPVFDRLRVAPFPNPYWNVTRWVIDWPNSSGCASDANNGTQSTCGAAGSNQGPLASWHEYWNRSSGYASTDPICTFPGEIRVTILGAGQNSAQSLADPVRISGHFGSGNPGDGGSGSTPACWLHILGSPTAVATTTISTLTAKNRSTPTPLKITVGTGGGQRKLYQNTTHTGFSWNIQSTVMAQPLQCTVTSALLSCAEINTWATTDAVTISTLPKVMVTRVDPQVDFHSPSESAGVLLDQLDVPDNTVGSPTEDIGDSMIRIGPNTSLLNCFLSKEMVLEGSNISNGVGAIYGAANVDFTGQVVGGQAVASASLANSETDRGFRFLGGAIAGAPAGGEYPALHDVILDDDIFLSGNTMFLSGPVFLGAVDNEATIIGLGGAIDIQSLNGASFFLWDNGTIDSGRSTVYYPQGATGGATTFAGGQGMLCGGQSAACLMVPTAATTTFNCNKTIGSGANLDTSLGSTVGLLACGGGGYSNLVQ